MGTRNLTAVMINGEYKVAQYGQWDGYPDGQGKTILNFLNTVKLDEFKKKLENVRFTNAEDEKEIKELPGNYWKTRYPQLSRDLGGAILWEILKYTHDDTMLLMSQIEFANDSLSCEFSYVVDFDRGFFEAYCGGFNHVEGSSIKRETTNLVKEYPLDDLPDEKTFLSEMNELLNDEEGEE